MTSLTDKMEKLRKDTPNEFDIGSERSTPRIIRDNGFNQGLDAAIALAEAEAAVVGDWEREFDELIAGYWGEHSTIYEVLVKDKRMIDFITTLLAAKDRERE